MKDFWAQVEAQLVELRSAATADDVLRILAHDRNPYGDPTMASNADGFFAGGGGDGSVSEALSAAGWSTVWWKARYHWAMVAPNGDTITYVEGDIFRGRRQ